jgi:HAD superfamily phosphoserine phosphatase-like hydrolase
MSRRLPVVVDWDGTITEQDTLHMLMAEFGDLSVFTAMEGALGRVPLDEIIATELATVHAPLADVVAWLTRHVRVRPGFAHLMSEHDPLVVSAGFHELIDPILEREGVTARVVANRLADGPHGLVAAFPAELACPVCGERCKRSTVAGLGAFAYVGDGVSDRCVSLAANRVFARAGLARWLDAQRVAYERFDDLGDVVRGLAAG